MQDRTRDKLLNKFKSNDEVNYTALSDYVSSWGKNNTNFNKIKQTKANFIRRSGYVPSFIFYEKKRFCAVCGWKYSIHIHHIDKNKEHNGILNLMGLCPNHHTLVHSNISLKKIEDTIIKKRIEMLRLALSEEIEIFNWNKF